MSTLENSSTAEISPRPKGYDKTVSFAPVASPIPPCCAEVGVYQALPTIRLLPGNEGTERGYVLLSSNCACDSRWITHDWSKGHAEFETINRAEAK